jgi:hypothetical protein
VAHAWKGPQNNSCTIAWCNVAFHGEKPKPGIKPGALIQLLKQE